MEQGTVKETAFRADLCSEDKVDFLNLKDPKKVVNFKTIYKFIHFQRTDAD